MTGHVFYVTGIHCPACKILIEDLLGGCEEVTQVSVDLRQRKVTVATAETLSIAMVNAWTGILRPHGYALHQEKPVATHDREQLIPSILLGLLLLGGFFVAQRSGLLSFNFDQSLTPLAALIVGLVASLSSCLAVVGGLVLSLSAQLSQDSPAFRPLALFHLGRIGGFFILGALLGMLGEAIAINFTITAILGILAATVMLLLGLKLLGLFKAMHYLSLPRGMFDRLTRIETGTAAPLFVGVATFFLPCGFTQSMQVAALASGSVVKGSLIMGFFALGTLPVLGLLSFGSFQFAHSRYAPLFFQTVGVVVIGFGLLSLFTGLAALSIIPPLFSY